MAKIAKTADDFDAYAAQLEAYAKTLREVSGEMRSVEMPYHYCHSGVIESQILPKVEHWVGQIKLDLTPAKRAFERGIKSRTEVQKDYKAAASQKKPRRK